VGAEVDGDAGAAGSAAGGGVEDAAADMGGLAAWKAGARPRAMGWRCGGGAAGAAEGQEAGAWCPERRKLEPRPGDAGRGGRGGGGVARGAGGGGPEQGGRRRGVTRRGRGRQEKRGSGCGG